MASAPVWCIQHFVIVLETIPTKAGIQKVAWTGFRLEFTPYSDTGPEWHGLCDTKAT
ncbi:MAG: hypothetical protein HY667_06210 [Chloroflexi bacterium]|nr:hypothetical protein [Chloroflexota bacterium]